MFKFLSSASMLFLVGYTVATATDSSSYYTGAMPVDQKASPYIANVNKRHDTGLALSLSVDFNSYLQLAQHDPLRYQTYPPVVTHAKIPASLVRINARQDYAIVVDLSIPRLFLFDNRDEVPRLIKDFYVSIGKNGIGKYREGDQKTPVGIYFITHFIDSKDLPDRYGSGAFPINYPNVIDKQAGRTGYGIWLHGVERDTDSRPPRDSAGCIVLRNQDLEFISKYIERENTAVILAMQIEWNDADQWRAEGTRLMQYIAQWRSDWGGGDDARYLHHYASTYLNTGADRKYQRRLEHEKYYLQADLADPSIFRYSDGEDTLIAAFMPKNAQAADRYIARQYWKMGKDNIWRIMQEEFISE